MCRLALCIACIYVALAQACKNTRTRTQPALEARLSDWPGRSKACPGYQVPGAILISDADAASCGRAGRVDM